MRLPTVLLGLLTLGLVAAAVASSRRPRMLSTRRPRTVDWSAYTGRTIVRRRALTSPNTAERLEARNAFGSPVGAGTPMARSGAPTDDAYGSSSQQGSEPVGTGLTDFNRGA